MSRPVRYLAALAVLIALILPTRVDGSIVRSSSQLAARVSAAASCAGAHTRTFAAGRSAQLAVPLLVSLEWNTGGTDAFTWWQSALRQASQFLYDATNKQATLGTVRLEDNACDWARADVRVYAHNTGVPDAAIGGLAATTVTALHGHPESSASYPTGSIHLGRTWSQFGPLTGRWTEADGYRTVVHELGHFVFYLYDEYYRYDDASSTDPRPMSYCTKQRYFDASTGSPPPPLKDDAGAASVMYWEYSTHKFWNQGGTPDATCLATRQGQIWHRSDWQVIAAHYPAILPPPGPNSPPITTGAPPPCSSCNLAAVNRWLFGPTMPDGIADGYLIKAGGTRVLHEGLPYPGASATGGNCGMPTGVVYPPGCLEVDGGGAGDLTRITGVDSGSGQSWQAVEKLNGPSGSAAINRRPPFWYSDNPKLPLIDAAPVLSGSPAGLSGLALTAYDPPGARPIAAGQRIDATLFESGLGPLNTPRSSSTTLSATVPAHTGLLSLLPKQPILDGALYLTPDLKGRPEQPIGTPDSPNGSAWAMAYVSLACDSPTSYLGAHAPGDEGGLDSADGVVNVHLIGKGLEGICFGFTAQYPDTHSLGTPATAAYSVHASGRFPASAIPVVTMHYDRHLLGNGWPELVQYIRDVQGAPRTIPVRGQCADTGSATVVSRIPAGTAAGIFQVVSSLSPISRTICSSK